MIKTTTEITQECGSISNSSNLPSTQLVSRFLPYMPIALNFELSKGARTIKMKTTKIVKVTTEAKTATISSDI